MRPDQLVALFSEANIPISRLRYTPDCANEVRTAWLAGVRAGRLLERLLAIDPRYGLCPRCLGTGVVMSPVRGVAHLTCSDCDSTGLVVGEGAVSAEPPTLDDLEDWVREMLEEEPNNGGEASR